MKRATLGGDPALEITLRRSARARRISLRVSSLDGRVTLSLPKGMDADTALDFAREKSDWIRKHLARQLQPVPVKIGATVPVRGTDRSIVAGPVRTAKLADNTLMVPENPDMAAARIKAFLVHAARCDLAMACKKYGARLGRGFGRLTVRDTRSRWGSCTSAGNLMFSWRLIMAPPQVLDYVAAHEVAHLVEMNHSPAYWKVVGRICPHYEEPRQWLRKNGQDLHRFRFGD